MQPKNRRRTGGQSLVEAAIILPVLIVLIMGIIDFGLLFNNYILISNAAREGARQAALGANDVEVVQTVENMTTTLDLSNMTITVTPGFSLRTHGAEVKVEIIYENPLITPLIDKFFPDGKAVLDSKSIMRVE